MLAWAYLHQGLYEDAARKAQRSINAFAGWPAAWATLAVACAGLGQFDKARGVVATCRSIDGVATREGYLRFVAYVVRDETARAKMREWLELLWTDQRVAHWPE
jgi:hypothetical protein